MSDSRFRTSVWQPPDPVTGRVLVLPGSGYTVDHPLLSWACQVADSVGWQVCTMHWQLEQDKPVDPVAYVEQAAGVLDAAAPRSARTVVIAKSLGTLAAPWARARGYPGIWLTPLLNDDTVQAALAVSPQALIVGGTADRHWNGLVSRSLAGRVVEIDDAGHGLTVAGNWRASLDALSVALVAIEQFLTVQAPR